MEKVLKKLKFTKTIGLSGERAIKEFKDNVKNYTIVRETQNSTVFSFVVYSRDKYEKIVSMLVRDKYDLDSELAILRQRDTKPEEFAEYNKYVEECKRVAKAFIEERTNAD